ncbi:MULTISPECIES: hypothetical protein [Pelosinus]|uniref:Uncharacterized protein n=1 Tax=Pelosinus fermentans B4 TaxID=1149862 RepID=I8RKR7_9FIRM|nr:MULTISPECIES: hypothetical protein [Pelosinus]EIW19050.1 hypothetical protein FB4_0575 [Pelosinus fermentans B4]EIW21740.1 hypothetical protein FA11_0547 [Pelosinus fermentans A11]OAM95412.1 hypothetical protein FR7_03433 [Pelosinus fermentans DSM 17108]SDR27725.1 hypothetical protein SAMN04515679_3572 [Pelosinus fermentans]
MEIGKTPQTPGKVTETAQVGNAQRSQEVSELSSSNQLVQKDFQVNLEDSIKTKLADLAKSLQNREQLLQSLPEDIKKIVQQLLQQMSSTKDVSQGMDYLLKAQKNIAEQLHNLGNSLELALTLQQDKYQDIKLFLNKVAEFLKGQDGMSPDQLANQLLLLAKEGTVLVQSNLKQAVEQFLQQLSSKKLQQFGSDSQENIILQLAKQLTGSSSLSQGDVKQIAKQLLQQIMPENMSQLTENDQKAVIQLMKMLESKIPLTQQQAAESGLPDLPEIWSVAKAVDAQQFKDIAPKVLQQAANALEDLLQEMKASPDKSAVAAKLEAFGQSLPPEIGKAVQQLIKQGITEQSLVTLGKTLENAALLNGKISEQVKNLVSNLAENMTAKSLASPAADLLAQVAKQLAGATTTIEQLTTLMKQINQQLSFNQGKLLEKAQSGLEQLTKTMEQNIPQALQDMAAKSKLPELSKIWVLLKAAGAEPWQNADSQNLQRSASIIKELAHSLYKSIAGETERQVDHKTLSFSVPLYFADGTSYPTHIHIYHQEKENNNQGTKRQFETWMRVSVDTQNIGIVDSVFRLYEENKLDLRVIFPDTEAISEFKQSLPDIRKSIEDTTLTLTNIMINKI